MATTREQAANSGDESGAHGVEISNLDDNYGDQPGQRRTPQIIATPKALDHRGRVAGSKDVNRTQGYHEEIPALPTPGNTSEARPGSCKRQQAACCEVLSVEDGPLPRLPIPRMDEEAVHC